MILALYAGIFHHKCIFYVKIAGIVAFMRYTLKRYDHATLKQRLPFLFYVLSDECICQAPVTWQFMQLDKDSDAQISDAEMKLVEANGYEHCVVPFMDSCDHDQDGQLSEREWCCCFADVCECIITSSVWWISLKLCNFLFYGEVGTV